MADSPDVIFVNARVSPRDPSMNSREPFSAVAVRDGRIQAIGSQSAVLNLKDRSTRFVDCNGCILMAGFHDAHCHLFSLSSSLSSLDCGPTAISSINEIKTLLQQASKGLTPGTWVKAHGYDHLQLSEKRHPNRHDVDAACPEHPVRIDHVTGHATVLNTRAMQVMGITQFTPDPPQGIIVRELDGKPTGLLYEMSSYLRDRTSKNRDLIRPPIDVSKVNDLLLSRGITSIQDAGADNGIEKWKSFKSLKGEDLLAPRVTMMIGRFHVDQFSKQGLVTGCGDDFLRVGAVKYLLTLTTGSLQPSVEEIEREVQMIAKSGYQIAFHAVEEEAVLAAARLISGLQSPILRHRIEHCSEATPRALLEVRRSGAVVVTNPGFLLHRGDTYLSSTPANLLPYLYPFAALSDANIKWAAASDAPVSPPDPLASVYAAVARCTNTGRTFNASQSVSVIDALNAWTEMAAYSCHQEFNIGKLATGNLADMVILDRDPTEVMIEEIRDIKTVKTVIGGDVVWEA